MKNKIPTLEGILAQKPGYAPRTRNQAKSKRCANDGSFAVKSTIGKGKRPLCGKCLKKYLAKKNPLYYAEEQAKPKSKSKGERGAYLPKSLVNLYEAAMLDDSLISLREDIATYEARIRQLAGQLRDDPRNGSGWATVLDKMVEGMERQIQRGSLTYSAAFKDIKDFMATAANEKVVWAEIYQVSDLKRKAVASESKRLNELGWTPETVFSMIGEIADIIKPLLTAEHMATFMEHLATSRLFNNQQFSFLDQVRLTTMTIEEQLLSQEIIETKKKGTKYIAA